MIEFGLYERKWLCREETGKVSLAFRYFVNPFILNEITIK